jgi:hypothetical protein
VLAGTVSVNEAAVVSVREAAVVGVVTTESVGVIDVPFVGTSVPGTGVTVPGAELPDVTGTDDKSVVVTEGISVGVTGLSVGDVVESVPLVIGTSVTGGVTGGTMEVVGGKSVTSVISVTSVGTPETEGPVGLVGAVVIVDGSSVVPSVRSVPTVGVPEVPGTKDVVGTSVGIGPSSVVPGTGVLVGTTVEIVG